VFLDVAPKLLKPREARLMIMATTLLLRMSADTVRRAGHVVSFFGIALMMPKPPEVRRMVIAMRCYFDILHAWRDTPPILQRGRSF